MFKVIIDANEVQRKLSKHNVPPGALEAAVSWYLTKSFGLPTTHRPGVPGTIPMVPTDVLDTLVGELNLIECIEPYYHDGADWKELINVTVDNGFLIIST